MVVIVNSLNHVYHMQSASEVVYVAEVLLCFSSDGVKQAPVLPPCPNDNEKGRNGG